MSHSPICPECKKRPVVPGRYLCAQCESAIVAATEAESEQMNRSFGHKPRKSKTSRAQADSHAKTSTQRVFVSQDDAGGFRWPWRKRKDLDTQITEEFDRALQRPRWMQYSYMFALIIIGAGCLWSAKVVAGNTNGRVAAVRDVRDTLKGISQSWRRLNEALN